MAQAVQLRRLTLRTARREAVGRTATALEDAFRVASLPGEAGAVVLVRRLDLGAIPPRATPQALALRLEAALRQLEPTRLRAGDRVPGDAPAIVFPDRAEALAALLLAARHGAPRGWWWPCLLPEAATAASLDALVPAALAAAGRQDPAAVPALLARLLALGALDAVLAALPAGSPTDATGQRPAPQGVASAGQPAGARTAEGQGTAAQPTPRARRIAASLPQAWLATLGYWAGRWGAEDPRSRWLARAALAHCFNPAAGPEAAAVLGAILAARPVAPQRASPAAAPPVRDPPAAAAAGEVAVEAAAFRPPSYTPHRPGETLPATATAMPPDDATEPSPWRSTRHAGLFFLLAGFARLGLDRLDPTQPDLPLRLLRFLAARLRIRPEDPMRACLPTPLPDPPPARFAPPPDWPRLLRLPALELRRIGTPGRRALTGPRGRPLAGLVGPGDVAALPRGLRNAAPLAPMAAEARLMAGLALTVSTFLRRRAGLSLRHLVRRPGLVLAGGGHIEVRLHARFVEPEIRAAGLDLDPGWVPWLGRSLAFTYDYGEAA